jgi:folate-dependent phosphoribosylglycinamide formyltransferase PurN
MGKPGGEKWTIPRTGGNGVAVHYVIHDVDRGGGEPIQVEYVDFKSGETLEDMST